jgi:hypothetical protein
MMATVRHVTSKAGRTKFQATGFLLNRVYKACSICRAYGSQVCNYCINQKYNFE